jgi:plastocyanin
MATRDRRGRGRLAGAALATAALLALAAACGGDDDAEGGAAMPETAPAATAPVQGGKASVQPIPADPQRLAFARAEVSAPAGTITLRMPNPSETPHNIALDQPTPVEGDVVGKGGVSQITAELPAGTYEYYCSVPGHRDAGMVGTLTVQ